MEIFRYDQPIPHERETDPERSVIARIIQKRLLMLEKNDEHERICPAVVLPGGGMTGIVGASVLNAFERYNLTDAIPRWYGSSVGAANAAYAVAGQGLEGPQIYYEVAAKLMNPWNFGNVVDIDHLIDTFRNVFPLNIDAIRNSRSQLFVGVTDKSGKPVYLDMHDPTIDIFEAIRASTAVPVGYKNQVCINGHVYGDGCVGCYLPIEEAITRGATDVLVILNRPLSNNIGELPFALRKLAPVFMRKDYTSEFIEAALRMNATVNHELQFAANSEAHNANVTIIAPSEASIGFFTKDKRKLQDASRKAMLGTFNLISKTSLPAPTATAAKSATGESTSARKSS